MQELESLSSGVSKDYFLFKSFNGKTSKLTIVFSAAGSKSFTGFNLLKKIESDFIFIRDPNRSWYNEGVKDAWGNFSELCSLIESFVKLYDRNNVTFTGGSMGGYASILFGSILKVGRVLAFSPQMMLDHRLPNNPSVSVKLMHKNIYVELANNTETDFQIYVGSECLEDIYNIYPSFLINNIQVRCILGAPHNVMEYLHNKNTLVDIIKNTIYVGEPGLALSELSIGNSICDIESISNFIEFYYFGVGNGRGILKLTKRYPQWRVLNIWVVKYCLKVGEYGLAEDYLLKIDCIDEEASDLHYDLGNSAMKSKHYDFAEIHFKKAIEIKPDSSLYISKLGALMMLKGSFDAAFDLQDKALRINPNNITALYQCGLLSIKSNLFQRSVYYFKKSISLGDKNPMTVKHLNTALNKIKEAS
jgi:hypothetical protein